MHLIVNAASAPVAAHRSAEVSFKAAFQTVEVARKASAAAAAAGGGAAAAASAEASSTAPAVALSDEYPVDDFRAAVAAGRLEAGVASMSDKVSSLVDRSVRDRCVGH